MNTDTDTDRALLEAAARAADRQAYDAWYAAATFEDMGSEWTWAAWQAACRYARTGPPLKLKRYDFFCSYDGGGPADEEELPWGEYVRYDDARAEVAREVAAAVAQERERCARVCESPVPGLVYKRRPMDWRECAAIIRATPC